MVKVKVPAKTYSKKEINEVSTARTKELKKNDEKKSWKELKDSAKERKLTRKNAKFAQHESKFFDLVVQAKKIWEKLRRRDCTAEEKQSLAKSLHNLFRGNYKHLVSLHDMARIVQWVIKLGTEEMKLEMLSELKPDILSMIQQKYANYCVRELLEHGSSRQVIDGVIGCFLGHTVKLLLNNHAANIVADAYKKYANTEQKCSMRQDLYGDVFKVFKNKDIKNLTSAEGVVGEMKQAVLNCTYSVVTKLIEKNRAYVEIVHSVTHDLLHQLKLNSNEFRDLKIQLQSHIHVLSTSRDGAWVAMCCVWNSTAKERKEIMKLCREHLDTIINHVYGYYTFMAMFDCIDDTVLLSKIILEPIVENALQFSKGESSMKVLEYLTIHRDTQFFPPSIIEVMEEGDSNPNSKKPMETRRSEILKFVGDRLLANVSSNLTEWLTSNNSCMVLRAIFKSNSGNALGDVYSKIASFLASRDSKLDDSKGNKIVAMEHLGVHKMLRMLIAHDKTRFKNNPNESIFSDYIAEQFGPNILWWLDINRGAFILVVMLETGIPKIKNAILTFLKPYEAKIEASNVTGSKILLKKMKEGM